jgi:hypothetical protein
LRTAQQVFVRALVGTSGSGGKPGAVTDEQDRTLLWNEFLELMRKSTSNPDLKMAELKLAIQEETTTMAVPEPVGSLSASADYEEDNNDVSSSPSPLAKRPRLENNSNNKNALMIKKEEMEESRTHVVTAADVHIEQEALTELLTENAQQDPDFMAAWMVRDGDAPPQPPEPPLFSAAPPKLSDPTASDLLGEELALSLIQRLLEPSGTVLLEVCRGLWTLVGLKEKQAKKALGRLDETVQSEMEKMQARLNERLSVAGPAEAAVRQMNETERRGFKANCNQQRQHVSNGIAWEFRQLLWVQQQLLTKLKVPGFDGTTVDAAALEFQARVCSYLHSAFYLRKRIGETTHVKMLKSQAERLKQIVINNSDAAAAAAAAAPVPSRAHSSVPKTPPRSPVPQHAMGYTTQQQQQQYNMGPPQGYGYPGQPQQQQQPQMMMPSMPPGTYQQQGSHQQQNYYQ